MGAFFAPAAICCFLTAISLPKWNRQSTAFILAGSALYLVGAMVVTFAFNVPATVDPASPEGVRQWGSYLTTWTNCNHLRAAAALLAAASFTVAFCLVR